MLFEKQEVSDESPDGIPSSKAQLRNQVNLALVSVPPGLLLRAASDVDVPAEQVVRTRLCAVFEKYGFSDKYVLMEEERVRKQEDDIATQMRAWCDYGDSFRTETDVLNPDGADLFVEPFTESFD